MEKIVIIVRERFNLAIETKNGWGKNEIKALLDEIIIEVLAENVKVNQ